MKKSRKELSEDESKIVQSIENGTVESIPNVKEEMQRLQKLARESSRQKKAISIRLNEQDLYFLKKRALETGINYQNIIQSLIHQYVHGKIKPEL